MKPSHPLFSKGEKIRDAYNKTAEFYNQRYKYIQYVKYGILLPKLIRIHSSSNCEILGPILDLGGGTGLLVEFLQMLSNYLKGHGTDDEKCDLILKFTRFLLLKQIKKECTSFRPTPVIICDISFEMLNIARKNLDRSKQYGLVACDCSHLPFRDKSFSIATTFTLFQNVDEIGHAIEELFRIMSNGGTLGISQLKKQSNNLKFAGLVSSFFSEITPVHYEDNLAEFQKHIVQLDKYTHFHDLANVEDFFIIAKKIAGNKK